MEDFIGLKIPGSLGEIITPQNTALVVYDMQAGITGQVANGQEITNKVGKILESARKVGVRTFFTRHMSLPKELDGRFSMPDGYGVATSGFCAKNQANVFEGQPRLSHHPRTRAAAQRSHRG